MLVVAAIVFFALGILFSYYFFSSLGKKKWKKNLKSVAKLDYINGEYCGQCRKVISKKDCLNSYEVCDDDTYPCNWKDDNGSCKASNKVRGQYTYDLLGFPHEHNSFAYLNPKTGSSYWFILSFICFTTFYFVVTDGPRASGPRASSSGPV